MTPAQPAAGSGSAGADGRRGGLGFWLGLGRAGSGASGREDGEAHRRHRT